MKDALPNARRMSKALIKDDLANVTRVIKDELPVLEKLLAHGDMQNTVVRMFFGATERIPTRALGYVASALRTAKLLGSDNVQIISAAHLGAQVNGVDARDVVNEFNDFARTASALLIRPGGVRLCFAIDNVKAAQTSNTVRATVESELASSGVIRQLGQRGSKHGGDSITYAVGHFVYQDTAALQPVDIITGHELSVGRASVYVGCQQEEIFHAARLSIRNAVDCSALGLRELPSVQIITGHVSAPYFNSNGETEQHHGELRAGNDLITTHSNTATVRDLDHLARVLNEGEI
jgi:hypothetical protein